MTTFADRRTKMVDNQVRPSDVTKFPIIEAMLAVPREAFVPADRRETAYLGGNLDLGQGRVMLEPRTLAKMLDALDIGPTDLVLDIGCGLGYSTAVLARMAEAVIGVEASETLARDAEAALSENGLDNAVIQCGPLAEGAARHGPYDVIVVEGGIEVLPEAIAGQLKDGGRMAAIFLDGALGTVRVGVRLDGRINWRFAFNASAPLLAGFEKPKSFVF
jgi:protein-L-isoaspartate(D-aspartate) O-methyltransferase